MFGNCKGQYYECTAKAECLEVNDCRQTANLTGECDCEYKARCHISRQRVSKEFYPDKRNCWAYKTMREATV